jgi:hypothetical protein
MTEVLEIYASSTRPVTLRGNYLEKVGTFTYLGSVIHQPGGVDTDVKCRIREAGTADFTAHKTPGFWKSQQISTQNIVCSV